MTVTTPGDDQGWSAEFAAICDTHRGRLVRWLTAIFGARDAEDIAQEALARLYARPGLLDPGADPWPWLSVVARNVGRDLARHNAFAVPVESAALELVADRRGVHDQAVAREDAGRLAAAFGRLGARDRALIQLRDVEGVPVGEIADRLRMNDNAVRQQLYRARKRLAGAYVALGGDRQAGVLALLGLKAREFLRRHGHLLNALSPSSAGALAAVGPALAAALGMAYALVGAPAADPARAALARPAGGAAAAAAAAAEPTAARGPGTARARAAGAAPRGAGAARPSPAAVYRHSVGPVGATATFHQDPLDTKEGPTETIEADVYVPVVGYHHHEEINGHREGSGENMACRAAGGCRRHIPSPAPARTL